MTPLDRLRSSPLVKFTPGPSVDAAALVLEPHFGAVEWTPPKSYAEVLSSGAFSVGRDLDGMTVDLVMLSGDGFTGVNRDLVHMPEGVSIDEGVTLSTNHLVGFATSGSEAVWCFDVTQPGSPVYYHHQDKPRARVLETGEWNDPKDEQPDFASFEAWLEAMSHGFTAQKPPRWFVDLGAPHVKFS